MHPVPRIEEDAAVNPVYGDPLEDNLVCDVYGLRGGKEAEGGESSPFSKQFQSLIKPLSASGHLKDDIHANPFGLIQDNGHETLRISAVSGVSAHPLGNLHPGGVTADETDPACPGYPRNPHGKQANRAVADDENRLPGDRFNEGAVEGISQRVLDRGKFRRHGGIVLPYPPCGYGDILCKTSVPVNS